MRKLGFVFMILLAGCVGIPFVQEGEGKALDKLNEAEELFKQQKYEDAIPSYEYVIKMRYLLMEPYKRLAICYEKVGKDDDAIRILEKSMLVTNKDEENLQNLIRLYVKVGRVEDAKKTQQWLNSVVKSQTIGGTK